MSFHHRASNFRVNRSAQQRRCWVPVALRAASSSTFRPGKNGPSTQLVGNRNPARGPVVARANEDHSGRAMVGQVIRECAHRLSHRSGPADSPPVSFRGRIWIRIGPRRGIASAQDERILNEKRRAGDKPFDVQPVPSATLSDLDRSRSLMPLAQEARKPMFFLKPADGAIGGHAKAVQDCYQDFRDLARTVAHRCGVAVC